MIAEDVLERGLAAAAASYDVPAEATERLRELISPRDIEEPRQRVRRPSSRAWILMAAASGVALIILAVAVGGTPRNGGGNEAAGPSANTAGSGGGQGATFGYVQGGTPKGARSLDSTARLSIAHAPSASAPGAVASPVPAPRTQAFSGHRTFATSDRLLGSPDSARVIKSGELDLQVPKGDVTSAVSRVTSIATAEGGYVANSRTSEGGVEPSGEITLRVPVERFEDAVAKARSIATSIHGAKVLSLQTAGQDVTSKYVDLSARIHALQKTRESFLELLSRAKSIGATLAVQQHVTDVQTQIEQLQGQRKVIADQSALSTLTVTVDQRFAPAKAKPQHRRNGFVAAVDRSVSRFVRGVEAIVGVLGPILLALLLLALALLIGRVGYRAMRRRLV